MACLRLAKFISPATLFTLTIRSGLIQRESFQSLVAFPTNMIQDGVGKRVFWMLQRSG